MFRVEHAARYWLLGNPNKYSLAKRAVGSKVNSVRHLSNPGRAFSHVENATTQK